MSWAAVNSTSDGNLGDLAKAKLTDYIASIQFMPIFFHAFTRLDTISAFQGKGNELALGRHGRPVKILQKLLNKATLLSTYKRTHIILDEFSDPL